MSEERVKTVRSLTDDLHNVIYQLDGFITMLRDIIDDMPFQEEKEDYSVMCQAFCSHENKKLDVLTSQLLVEIEESNKLVSALEKEVFAQ